MLKKTIKPVVFALLLSGGVFAQTAKLTRHVDPFIGTGGHGHVFMGANVPFGAVQLGPVNLSKGWDWCSGYHYSDSTIVGFAHTHLSGTGIGDLGDVELMPVSGAISGLNDVLSNSNAGTWSLFSHKDEVAKPGYYSVRLKRYGIKAEMTATTRVGYHRYTFPAGKDAQMVISLQNGISSRPVKCYIEQVDEHTIRGYRYTSGWATDRRIFFSVVFSKPVKNFSIYNNGQPVTGKKFTATNLKAVLNFGLQQDGRVLAKVGISPVSMDNAQLNINTEAKTWDFDQIKNDAQNTWEKALNSVAIKADAERSRTFYTALYHTMITPSVFNDCNGDYWGTDKKVHHDPALQNVTTLSLWDTYRAENPLLTILQPGRVPAIINSMLAIYQQQGKLPVWHLMANETNTMPGNSAIPIVADAVLKGIKGINAEQAYQAAKATAMRDERGLNFVKSQGFIPADTMVETVATGLEYAIDDWCIAQMAKMLHHDEDYAYFSKRGKYYTNYFDSSTHFMRGRVSATEWRLPFSPFVAKHMKDDFTEGNAWQYTWLVPQDVEGLIQLQGGVKPFTQKLDSLFVATGDLGGEASPDISGLIGQYAHGNEPSHHIAYLYNYVGQPYKTADKVRFVMDNFYTNKPDGIIGNEDVGQMSAWYVFSAMGFYPVNPANGTYVLGSPLVDNAVIALPGGKHFTISIKNNSKTNKYVQTVYLNGAPYKPSYIRHADVMKGGNMTIIMGAKPSATWGVSPAAWPHS
ncbi:glycoside hydrolase family 92 protein [Mucilaginibacter mali]|uniref:Glycoside hydrolase family 92 protein n=1 Tax=Mucilaginibacter mali TaxID=2740462 RepID=A0A7D4UEI3_9SPHI|nr:GH92 family glycosyl hydrolase [Mucilaginibacter mali]QKJ29016.1 glycoside hydrolase family 92 protein [Mucilaginibacter mali]